MMPPLRGTASVTAAFRRLRAALAPLILAGVHLVTMSAHGQPRLDAAGTWPGPLRNNSGILRGGAPR
jgi:hypothetical protein